LTIPNRNSHKRLIESQVLTNPQIAVLRQLSAEVEAAVRSEEFSRRVEIYRWNTAHGHCAVASCAMQILAWVAYSVYLDTYNAVSSTDRNFSHWFVCDPSDFVRLDPTGYQFEARENGSVELNEFYTNAVRRGHPSRRRTAPYYTNSPPVRYVIDVVSSRLGFADNFRCS